MRLCNAPASDRMFGPRPTGRIGPNAITRLADALQSCGSETRRAVFERAELAHYLQSAPTQMVEEDEVLRLHAVLRRELGLPEAARVSIAAGHATANYLLAHRIPALARRALRVLPTRLGASLLARAISQNAWTFVGSGTFDVIRSRPTLIFRIAGSPLCRGEGAAAPLCHYYAATFEHLFSSMLGKSIPVRETQCTAMGALACLFEVDLANRLDGFRAQKCKCVMTSDATGATVPSSEA